MKIRKKLLLVIACVAAIAPGVTLPMPLPQQVEPAAAVQALHATTRVAAYSFAEITSVAEHTASQAIGSAALDEGSFSGQGGLWDPRETLTPVAAGRDTHFVSAVAQRSERGQELNRVTAPAVPEPAGWVLLVSGLAVVAGIARRRTSLALM